LLAAQVWERNRKKVLTMGQLARQILRVRKLAFASTRPGLRRAARLGVFPTIEHLSVLKMLGAVTVVDVGAHRGQFGLAVRSALPDARLIGFEPQPNAAQTYRQAVPGQLELRECALGEQQGSVQMNISRASDSSSILPIGAAQIRYFPGTEKSTEILVRMSTLDIEFGDVALGHQALLKVDVQGYEMAVLRGGVRVLSKFDWIYVELSFVELYEGQELASEIISFLGDQGFRIVGVHNAQYSSTGSCLQADVLFASVGPSSQ
jgi:FkbM family methyltransferase